MKQVLTLSLWLITTWTAAQSSAQASYAERTDPHVSLGSWQQTDAGVNISFVSPDVRFPKSEAPVLRSITHQWNTKAWKGEKVHTQLLIWAPRMAKGVNLEAGDLRDNNGNTISAKHLRTGFIRYVMTDGLNSTGGGCGIQPAHDSALVADVIDDHARKLDLVSNTTQPVWVSLTVQATTPAGTYHGTLKVKEGDRTTLKELAITVQVINYTLPSADKWQFHLDLWQNPYAVARIHHVKPWSAAHMKAMRPYMERLAQAGQKAITTSVIHDPWNSQTLDQYQSMIRWIKKKDGSWRYDYTVFDQWVSYMMSLGINKIVNCYSMIPWNLKFYYYDEALAKDTLLVAKPGTMEYNAHWQPMLKDFARHLKEKGWFSKTAIAMDERPMEDMQKAIAVIKQADKDFKISLAGNYHEEISNSLTDYSVASNQVIPQQAMSARKTKGDITTYYTCCTEGFPNTFTFSPPAESVWLAWFAANKGYDGFLRWAYNCWPKDPLQDSRFGSWSAGDTFLVYPGNRSSIRFERLIEGIQDFEKIRILRETFTTTNQPGKLTRLDTLLRTFEINNLQTTPAADMVKYAHTLLNDIISQ